MDKFSFNDCHARFVNLDHRHDRLMHMIKELDRVSIPAQRYPGIRTRPDDLDEGQKQRYPAMYNRTPGAIGCYLSQLGVMGRAMDKGKHAFVMEDDLIFCDDIQDRFRYIENFINTEAPDFDVFWLGGTFHIPAYWHTGSNPLLPHAKQRSDAERTSDRRIFRTYGCFSTHAYIVNVKSIPKIIGKLHEELSTSIGIDYSFIKRQPEIKSYAFVPGCVKQLDNRSDIGQGDTIYSGFSRLNGNEENSRYWWQANMNDFDPDTFDWKDANK